MGKSCSFGQPYVHFVLCIFVNLAGSHFGFDGGIVVSIAPVLGHRLPFTFRLLSIDSL